MAFLMETKISRQPMKCVSKRLMIAVRIRPLKADETGRRVHCLNNQVVVLEENEADKNDILRMNRGGNRQYVFDAVFGEEDSQETIFEKTTRELVNDVLDGYNATIFAYGASGSGKTHTMLGNNLEPGIMVRALNEIFSVINKRGLLKQYNVTMSYLEIYNENIRDLLSPSSGCLELREDQKEKSIKVVNLSEVSTNSAEEMMRLLQKGNKARTMEPTALNKTSSRSHALLNITVRQTLSLQNNENVSVKVKQGKLFMIDLAGSERASQTKNQGKRLLEGAHINRSLLALGNCINALSGGATYVNYRDSKLTRLLKDALSGNSQTCMIAHVSPAAIHREESKNTLVYADRAKNITNKVEKNVLDISHQVIQYRTIISELKDEIERLKSEVPNEKKLQQQKAKPKEKVAKVYEEMEDNESLESLSSKESSFSALKNEIISTFREQMKLRKRLLNIESYLLELDLEAGRQYSILSAYEGKSSSVGKNEIYSGRMPDQPDVGSLELDYQEIERSPKKTLEKVMIELAFIEKEQEKYSEMKTVTNIQLEKCKEKASLLEKELPFEGNTEDGRELLSLLIRVYELEIEKIVLESERLTREYTLRQKDLTIEKYNKQREICEEIILRQRALMEEKNLFFPSDLLQLYELYQQEIHSLSYADFNSNEIGSSHSFDKLPPIRIGHEDFFQRGHSSDNGLYDSDNSIKTPSSSACSDWPFSPLPPINRRRHSSLSTNTSAPPPTVLFPPISKSQQEYR